MQAFGQQTTFSFGCTISRGVSHGALTPAISLLWSFARGRAKHLYTYFTRIAS